MSAAEIGNSFLYGDGCALPVEPEIDRDYNPCDKLEPEMVGEAREFCNALYKGQWSESSSGFIFLRPNYQSCTMTTNKQSRLNNFVQVTLAIILAVWNLIKSVFKLFLKWRYKSSLTCLSRAEWNEAWYYGFIFYI